MEEKTGKELGRLYKAIVNAIVKSEEVKRVIKKIQGKEKVCTDSLVVLMIKMRALAEAAEDLKEVTRDIKRSQRIKTDGAAGKTACSGQLKAEINDAVLIDGKKLSSNEKAFHEFLEKHFDEEKWLSDLKIDPTREVDEL